MSELVDSVTSSEKTHSRAQFYKTLIRTEHTYVELARKNPFFFMEYVTGMTPADHHIDWLNMIFNPKRTRINIIAFPGSAKTHTAVYSLAWLIGKMPWLTNIVVSVSSDQAKQRLSAVRELIQYDQRYKNVFPWIQMDDRRFGNRPNNATALNVWSSKWIDGKEIDYRQWRQYVTRYGEPKDNTLFAAGVTSKAVIGKRITGMMVIDDPHDNENSANEGQRSKVITSARNTLFTRLTPANERFSWSSKIIQICTRWHEGDMPGVLAEERRLDDSLVWDTLVTAIEDEDEKPTWPQVWSKEAIQKRAEEVGGKSSPMYRLSYMNDPQGASSGEITLDMLRLGIPRDFDINAMSEVYISCDFSHTEKLHSDYTVYAAIARDRLNPYNIYLLDLMRFKEKNLTKKVAKLAEFYDKVYETYGSIDTVLLEEADSKAEEQKLLDDYPSIPVKIVKVKARKSKDSSAKMIRFKPVIFRIQAGRFFINQSIKDLVALQNEIIGFPGTKHDDIVDAIDLPFQLDSWQNKIARVSYKEMTVSL